MDTPFSRIYGPVLRTMVFLLWALIPRYGQAQEKPGHLLITPLTGDFFIYTTWHMLGDKPYPANGLYVVTAQGVVLFDTPWDSTQFQPLLDSIACRHQKKVIICVATHFHEDRTGGLEDYTRHGIRTFTTLQTDQLSEAHGQKRARYLILKDTSYRVGACRFEIYYPGPGHSPDNIVVWFPDQRILYGGCLVKSTQATDLGNLSDADPLSWSQSIKHILKKFGQPAWVIPGHLSWDNNQSLQHTLRLLAAYQKGK